MQDLSAIRAFFETGNTWSYAFRKEQLLKLRAAILNNAQSLQDALYTDLKKSPEESYITETGFVLAEISYALRHLKQWMKPQSKSTNLVNFPASSKVLKEPLGVVFIVGPWNYPFQLLFAPLVGAIAAGNCVVLKPSEHAPATCAVMIQMIRETFDDNYVRIVDGDGASVVPAVISGFHFNHIFYTGSTQIGREIYKLAADQLVPVTLELGGKSPCVVLADANLKIAAKRIVITKFSNAGQMCVAPDYLLVHHSVKNEFIGEMVRCIQSFFGEDPSNNYNYGKIINSRQFNRLSKYLTEGKLVHGGNSDEAKLYIEPTIIELEGTESPLMQDEIFGPILPVMAFDTLEDARLIIAKNADPLAFYLYTTSAENEQRWLQAIPSGGACINNCSWHLANPNLPFGGRGSSGTGRYHGRYGFDTFSHQRAVMKTPNWFDPALKYPPLKGKLKIFKWLVR